MSQNSKIKSVKSIVGEITIIDFTFLVFYSVKTAFYTSNGVNIGMYD